MEALTLKEQDLIYKNVIKACENISKLNKRGYNYLYLCSGFIAHSNIHGFIAHYDDEGFFTQANLEKTILANEPANQWDNFREGDRDYYYYKSKAAVYKRICNKLRNKTLNLYNT
jgi:hypothetical protein